MSILKFAKVGSVAVALMGVAGGLEVDAKRKKKSDSFINSAITRAADASVDALQATNQALRAENEMLEAQAALLQQQISQRDVLQQVFQRLSALKGGAGAGGAEPSAGFSVTSLPSDAF